MWTSSYSSHCRLLRQKVKKFVLLQVVPFRKYCHIQSYRVVPIELYTWYINCGYFIMGILHTKLNHMPDYISNKVFFTVLILCHNVLEGVKISQVHFVNSEDFPNHSKGRRVSNSHYALSENCWESNITLTWEAVHSHEVDRPNSRANNIIVLTWYCSTNSIFKQQQILWWNGWLHTENNYIMCIMVRYFILLA
jgi:hypothetical protein